MLKETSVDFVVHLFGLVGMAGKGSVMTVVVIDTGI